MATTKKKPVAKKNSASKKPATKKPAAKKAPAKKTANAKKPTAKKTSAKITTRRPDPSPQFPIETIEATADHLNLIKAKLEEYAAHMRALDRSRHNGVGIKRQGFIERSYQLAVDNTEFLPHWLTIEKFNDDHAHFVGLRSLFDTNRQISELIWNMVVLSADMVYTDALEYYSQVQDAAKRRIDAAESIYNELHEFFRNMGPHESGSGAPTQKKAKSDFNAILKGKKDGVVIAKNIKPKTTGGKHEVIDETFKDDIQYKDTEQGEIQD